jgi:hypothetical protein
MSGQPIILRTQANRDFAAKFVGNLKVDPGKPFEVIVQIHRKKRSLSQNALMWKRYHEVADAVSDYTGMDPDKIHTFAKQRWLKPEIVEIGDTIAEHYSTKNLTPSEMTLFLDKFEAWVATDLGLNLTNPDDLGRE